MSATDDTTKKPGPARYRVALLKSMEHGFTCVVGRDLAETWRQDDGEVRMSGYVRVSDMVEVEFPPLTDDKVIAGAVRALDEQRAEVSREFGRKLAEIDRQRAELLSITHQVSA